MKKLFTIALLFLCFCPLMTNAQDKTEFSPDCPGATTGADVMPLAKIDWETGISYEWNRRNGMHEQTWLLNTSTFRFGLTRYAELRLQLDASMTKTPEESYAGISNASIGTKIKIFDGAGALPKVAFLGIILLPGASGSRYLPQHVGIQTHLLFENELNNFFTLGYDIGAEWSGNTDNPDVFFGICFNFQPTNKLSFFIESYNRYNSQKQEEWAKPGHSSRFNCMGEIGAAYMVSPRLQLNVYGDINFNELSKYANIGLGMAWLLN